MHRPRILIQLDGDQHASTFDAVVAVDSGVEHLLQYADIEPTNVRQLVHGAMFTRGANQLKNSAIFIGGSNTAAVDAIGAEVRQAFFGPVRVSVMVDGNGSNTTAAAAVLSAERHLELAAVDALILGGTGPVGQRVARLLLRQGGSARIASRERHRAEAACRQVLSIVGEEHSSRLTPVGLGEGDHLQDHLNSANAVFSCGAAGVRLLTEEQLQAADSLRVAIDLNAVPPAGLQGIEATDKAVQRKDRFDYGALGVGGLKMKIHREAVKTLFTRNDLFLDAEEIFGIGKELEAASVV